METIKLWKINGENITEIKSTKLDFENRLEKWIVQHISVISNDYLFLGSPVDITCLPRCVEHILPKRFCPDLIFDGQT